MTRNHELSSCSRKKPNTEQKFLNEELVQDELERFFIRNNIKYLREAPCTFGTIDFLVFDKKVCSKYDLGFNISSSDDVVLIEVKGPKEKYLVNAVGQINKYSYDFGSASRS